MPIIWLDITDNNMNNISCSIQGSPNLQKTGRLDFSLREHKGEVKTWQEDFQQLHRDMFLQKCVVSSHHLKKLHLKCAFANILLISFIFNIKFMFCTCITVVDLIFVDFRFYSFHIISPWSRGRPISADIGWEFRPLCLVWWALQYHKSGKH